MFKRGDIVKIIRGYWGSINDPDVGKVCVVKNTMQDGDKTRYDLMNIENGLWSAWWHDYSLEFIREGGEEAIKAAMEKRKETVGEEE